MKICIIRILGLFINIFIVCEVWNLILVKRVSKCFKLQVIVLVFISDTGPSSWFSKQKQQLGYNRRTREIHMYIIYIYIYIFDLLICIRIYIYISWKTKKKKIKSVCVQSSICLYIFLLSWNGWVKFLE